MKIKCLIVDDEKSARDGLHLLCSENAQLDVVGICKNGVEAINEINALKPQLVLLDVQMPGVNGFEVIASIPEPKPKIIFITAHDQFAIKAFEVNAIDYLLKPFSDERFEQAIHKAIQQINLNQQQTLDGLINRNLTASDNGLKINEEDRLVLKVDGAIKIISKSEIRFIEAYDYYIKIHVKDQFFMIRESLKNMESSLGHLKDFMRIHKSYIVNKHYISQLVKISPAEHELILTTNDQIKVSRSKLSEVKDWLSV